MVDEWEFFWQGGDVVDDNEGTLGEDTEYVFWGVFIDCDAEEFDAFSFSFYEGHFSIFEGVIVEIFIEVFRFTIC